MEILFWIFIFVISLAVMVKSADWLLESAERIGLAIGISSFVVGVTIVSLGTSFPELITAIASVMKGQGEMAPANAVGSNVANILLVVGFSVLFAGRLAVSRSLIDVELPVLASGTFLFLAVAWDGVITVGESVFLVVAYGAYLIYTIKHRDESNIESNQNTIPSREERRHKKTKNKSKFSRIAKRDLFFVLLGGAGLGVASFYLVDSVVAISEISGIGVGVITITAVAIGTSLPELIVSIKAALAKKAETAIGNIFGSNAFNALIVVGIPGLIGTIHLDEQTLSVGLPAMAGATFLFIISGISQRIHIWEGSFFLLLYLLFLVKLFELF